MRFRLVAAVLATAALAAISGCSSSGSSPASAPPATTATPEALSAAAYKQALHVVATEEARAQRRVSMAFHAKTVAQLRVALATFAADQTHVAGQLGALSPPANAVAPNSQLATAFRNNSTVIRELLPRLAHATSVRQALHVVQNDKAAASVGQAIDAALTQLRKLGYTSGS